MPVVDLPCYSPIMETQNDGSEKEVGRIPHRQVRVTDRLSKQWERPRNHTCTNCGERYRIDVRDPKNPKVISVQAT